MKEGHYLLAVIAVLSLGLLSFSATHAFFSDTGHSTGNVFTAATQFPIRNGDVIINELNWAGSTKGSDDEWIELKNTTGHSIDISNWQITKWIPTGTPHEALMLTIPASTSISSASLFLIAAKSPGVGTELTVSPDIINSSVALNNTNLQIKIYTGTFASSPLIDTAGDKNSPLAGVHSEGNPKIFYSMERSSTPGDGTISTNWHTATTSVNVDSDSGQNKATAKAIND